MSKDTGYKYVDGSPVLVGDRVQIHCRTSEELFKPTATVISAGKAGSDSGHFLDVDPYGEPGTDPGCWYVDAFKISQLEEDES